MMCLLRCLLVVAYVGGTVPNLVAAAPAFSSQLAQATPATPPDLTEFRTVDTAITVRFSHALAAKPSLPAYLGIHVQTDARGQVAIAQVDPESPAGQAGLQPGDI